MNNNTFFIVIRENSLSGFSDVKVIPNRDQWGWEFADNIEMTDYTQAKKMREEYAAAMPNHTVRIRANPIVRSQ